MRFDRIKKHLKRPQNLFYKIVCLRPEWIKNDKLYLEARYSLSFGRRLRLENPQTFSEKLQWLKLFDRKPEYIQMVDKYAAKEYVAKKVGQNYVVHNYGVWDKVEDIEWDKLPNQFVIKTTHDSGGIVICRDKSLLDTKEAEKKLKKGMESDFYYEGREWPYKNVPHRIIAEEYLMPDPETNDLPDYKFFCFNGHPKYCQLISGRGKRLCSDFYDKEWKHQSFHEPRNIPFADNSFKKPENYEKMWEIASILSEGIPFIRVDMYNVKGKIYCGELTFFPTSGYGGFNPEDWDYRFGEMLVLPIESNN